MLNLFPTRMRTCEGIERRDFLKVGVLSGLGLALPGLFAARQAQARERRKAADVNCILIWTRGGTSHHDTFDPKPDAPASVRGEFRAIDTAVPGVKFTEILPRMARELKRFALLRGWNPRNAGHGVAEDLQRIVAPHVGGFQQRRGGDGGGHRASSRTSLYDKA